MPLRAYCATVYCATVYSALIVVWGVYVEPHCVRILRLRQGTVRAGDSAYAQRGKVGMEAPLMHMWASSHA